MMEDGLEDVENLMDPEKEKQRDAMKLADVTSDNIGKNYFLSYQFKLLNLQHQGINS